MKKGKKTFEQCVNLYNEDEESEKTIKKNEAKALFEVKAFTLGNNKISDVIEDGNDYYLVYCKNSYDKVASEKNKAVLIKEKKAEFFNQNYNDFINKSKNDFNTDCFEELELPNSGNIKSSNLFEVYKEKTQD